MKDVFTIVDVMAREILDFVSAYAFAYQSEDEASIKVVASADGAHGVCAGYWELLA